jgi:hypothetical protein
MANHYYEPSYTAADIFRDPDEPRKLAGIDWNLKGQLALLETFTYGPDLLALEGRSYRGHDNGWFGPGDAEALYAMIRHFKPRRIVEIGCGQSTLVARFAIADTTAVDPLYQCRQICFEPFENPWLDELGVEVRRERIERADPSRSGRLPRETSSSSIPPIRSGRWATSSSNSCTPAAAARRRPHPCARHLLAARLPGEMAQ